MFSHKNTMNKFNTIKHTFLLTILFGQVVFPISAKAAQPEILATIKQKELTITESAEGKLFHPVRGVKRPNKVVMTVLSAYSSTPGQTDDDPFVAASGKRVYDGMVAANWLPMGTKIKIPSLYGEKVFTVDDRMNPRYGYGRIDIWLNAPYAEARKFGVKRAVVEVYGIESNIKVAKIDSI